MKYKSITAVALALGLFLTMPIADAANDKPTTMAQKELQRLLKKSKNSPTMTVKTGSRGGVRVVTSKQAPVLKADAKSAEPKVIKVAPAKPSQAKPAAQKNTMLVEKDGKSYFLGTELPADYKNIGIYGEAEASKKQAVALIKQNNPKVRLACSVEELVDLYWQEAEREGVRPDLALSQSLVETGTYAYGGDVQHHQNNFCGLGTTGGGVKGATFKTPELGVRAHIQHLLAYTQKKRPQTKIVDPRYELAHNIRMERGMVDTWYGLNGTWAMGSMYCEKIMATYQKMLAMPGGLEKKKDKKQDKQADKQKDSKKKKSMRQRLEELKKEKR